MHFLLTRPHDDSERFARLLIAAGHQVDSEPLLAIEYYPPAALDLAPYQAMIFTSANGVRAFVRNSDQRGLLCFAVGDATARAARELGFASVIAAGGNVESLAARIAQSFAPADGALLHISGETVAGDLVGALQQAGYDITRQALYRARPATALSPAARDLLRRRQISHMPFYSPRTADTFLTLIRAAGLADYLADVTALCLSPAVADVISCLPWGKMLIAQRPDQTQLFQLIDITLEEKGP